MTIATPGLWVGGRVGTASSVGVDDGGGTATKVVVEQPDDDQTYFFAPAWQALVERAESDLANGRVQEFATTEDLFADLDA